MKHINLHAAQGVNDCRDLVCCIEGSRGRLQSSFECRAPVLRYASGAAVDAQAMLSVVGENSAMKKVANEVNERLQRVIEQI